MMTNTTWSRQHKNCQADVLRLIYIINFLIELLNYKIKINESYWFPVSNGNKSLFFFSQPLRFAYLVLLHHNFDLNSITRSALSRADLTHLDWLRHFYELDFNDSPTGESFSLPAPSIKKKDSTETSFSSSLYIYPLLLCKQYIFGWECAAKTVWRDRVLLCKG